MNGHDYRATNDAAAVECGVSEWLEETKPQVWRKRCGFHEVRLPIIRSIRCTRPHCSSALQRSAHTSSSRRHSSSAYARLSHHSLFMIRTFELTMTVVAALAVSLAPGYRSVAPRQSLRRAQKDRCFQCARGTARLSTTTHSSTSLVRRDPAHSLALHSRALFISWLQTSCCFSLLSANQCDVDVVALLSRVLCR